MGSNLKKGLFLVTITGAVTAFPHTVQAFDQTAAEQILPQAGIEEVLSDCYLSDKKIEVEDYLVPTEKGEYLDMAFANVQTFLYIRSEPTTEVSGWESCIPIMLRRSSDRWASGRRSSPGP